MKIITKGLIIRSIIALGLFGWSFCYLMPILGVTGLCGLLLFCMAYKLSTTKD